jgi:hypothetical protein
MLREVGGDRKDAREGRGVQTGEGCSEREGGRVLPSLGLMRLETCP